jgi:membrane protease subunit (stomatin/prohibitin family)
MIIKNKFASYILTGFIATAAFTTTSSAIANGAGAFIGGVFATKLLENVNRNADAQEQQTAYQQQAVEQSNQRKSPQARISELDKLASGGYITPAEYKRKKKAILDSL